MVSVVAMPHPDLDVAKKRNAYGIKEDVLREMMERWEPFSHSHLKEKAMAIQEQKEEDES